MEKLQMALEKARKKRESEAADAPAGAPERGTAKGAQAAARGSGFRETAGLWQALPSIELDRQRLIQNRLVSLEATPDAASFDLLRTKTLLQMRKKGWKRLGITSATMGCGKTTTALNLALGLTRQADKSCVLFEMDMRRPAMARMLGCRPEFGVSDMLNRTVAFDRQAVRVGENVALAFNYGSEKNTSQLLMRDTTARIIDEIEETYQPDLMIFDLPPMLASDDTTAFLKNVDCALMIAGSERTTVSQVDSCEREIAEHTNVLGVVLNMCRFMEDEQAYGYNY